MALTFDQWLIWRLRMHGAYAGSMDGVHGRAVIDALKKFQYAEKIPQSGKADTATVTALQKQPGLSGQTVEAPKTPVEPVWMREARRYMGLKEIAGAKSNPTIMGWAKKAGGWIANYFTDDDIPWCGLAVQNWISTTLPEELLPSNPLGALNWKTFGREVPACVGAILVFERPGGGHVGFYVGEDRTHFHVLGGNQQNSVSITRVEKDRLRATRWPKTGEAPVPGRVQLQKSGAPISRNEA
ncbi:putative peptidoglycan binding domain protein [Agrobacterium sp. DSM 25558]|uniref:TIGR02594 family protein n=1 Tax=Agrobacterium sp. DSM 25558 TaxID=1907665 RepID=UPI0009725E13|nr:TIGR02594 family protein [Agrobacterium sp. DSM 25558]SCX30564.1 putative peptidoglycan binding domain protein [Agrobacterium sp. DSM 25558]